MCVLSRHKTKKLCNNECYRAFWCAEEDSNLHTLTSTSPSSLRVYQFHHPRNCKDINAFCAKKQGFYWEMCELLTVIFCWQNSYKTIGYICLNWDKSNSCSLKRRLYATFRCVSKFGPHCITIWCKWRVSICKRILGIARILTVMASSN